MAGGWGRARGGDGVEGKGSGEFGRHCLKLPAAVRGNEFRVWSPRCSAFPRVGLGAGSWGNLFFPSSPNCLLYKFPSSDDFNFTVHIFSQQNPEMTR